LRTRGAHPAGGRPKHGRDLSNFGRPRRYSAGRGSGGVCALKRRTALWRRVVDSLCSALALKHFCTFVGLPRRVWDSPPVLEEWAIDFLSKMSPTNGLLRCT
jgi:hypothetical protein